MSGRLLVDDPHFVASFAAVAARLGPATRLARVTRQDRDRVLVRGADFEVHATHGSRLDPVPVVGDFVAVEVENARVLAVLPRRMLLARRRAGSDAEPQALAANVDLVVLVCAADNRNEARLERGVSLARDAGADVLVVLTKSDLVDDPHAVRQQLGARLAAVDVLVTSCVRGDGLEPLARALSRGTSVLIGPSGAGKSALVNALLGASVAAEGAVRAADGKGRHTTTRRELFALPGGGWLVDTPGTRELGLLLADDADGAPSGFPDIDDLAAACRFTDCAHDREPGCAVRAAVADGTLDEARLASYERQRRELRFLAEKESATGHQKRARERRFGRVVKEAVQRKRRHE